MKFATKTMQHYTPHRTLPWEIKNSIFADI